MPAAVPIATVAAGALSASASRSAGNRAARAQENATAQQIAEQRRQFDLSRSDQKPFLDAGYDALDRQAAFLDGDMSGFENSADYLFNRQQMQQAVERGAAARGSLFSGGHSADLAQHMSGLAANQANTYWNRLAGRAGQGQTTASGLGVLGANMANNIGNSLQNSANARASSYINSANQTSGLMGLAAGQFANWYSGNQYGSGGGIKPIGSVNPYKG